MKITFVYPRFEKFLRSVPELDAGLIDYFLGDYTTPPSLGIPLLAALTPPEFEIELIDDNSGQPVDYDAPTDLVAINCFTPQATRAFEIADNFRARGKKVIMGGLFPVVHAGRMSQARRFRERRRRRAELAENSRRPQSRKSPAALRRRLLDGRRENSRRRAAKFFTATSITTGTRI